MTLLKSLLILIVAILHFYFMVLEMILWTKPQGLKVFRMTLEQAQTTEALAANQGLYNGFLVAGLVWSLIHPEANFAYQLSVFFLSCVIAAGLYGGHTVNKRIVVIQALPGLLALLSVVFIGQ